VAKPSIRISISRCAAKSNIRRKCCSSNAASFASIFFDKNRRYLESRALEAGDVILLIKGGHGFEVLEDFEMFEVKQGPYAGDADKTRFDSALPGVLNFGPKKV
jgi:hypothetical protein